MDGIEVAQAFVNTHFPNCLAALLFGSVARGEATESSDLDIIIVTDEDIKPYRKTYWENGWLIEAFIGNRKYNEEKIRRPNKNHVPSSLTAYSEAVILRDHQGVAQNLKETARSILEQGPDFLTPKEIEKYRYMITGWLDDFIDARDNDEAMFIAYDLTIKTAELLLGINQKWLGERKWLYRALKGVNQGLAQQLIEGLKAFHTIGDRDKLVKAVEGTLNLAGGKLHEGFSIEG